LTNLPDTASIVARRIYSRKEVRELELRDGKTLRNLKRLKFNLEAALGYTRGEEPEEPCATCSTTIKHRGPFKRCIVVAGEFDRACCNCRYNSEGSACTLHRQNAAPTDPRKPRSASAKAVPPPPRPVNRRTERADKLLGRNAQMSNDTFPEYNQQKNLCLGQKYSDWYKNIRPDPELPLSQLSPLFSVKDSIQNCVTISQMRGPTVQWFAELRTKLHHLEYYHELSPVLIKTSKILEEGGLSRIFEGMLHFRAFYFLI